MAKSPSGHGEMKISCQKTLHIGLTPRWASEGAYFACEQSQKICKRSDN
jgi:hypothetical protein